MAEPGSTGAPDPTRGPEPVAAEAARARSWLFEAAFPFLADEGVDKHGPGFVEHLRLDGTAADVPFKRVRDRIFTSYLDTQPAGTWIEYRDHLLRPKADTYPAGSFYHFVLAFSEDLRHAGQPKEAAT